jgi:peptide/nickel transport system ATP-binding protein
MTTPLLQVDGLTVRYRVGDLMAAAVRDVSLEVRAGETLGLVGESGSGKSSIGLALARALPESATTSGSIRLADTDVASLQGAALRRWWSSEFAMVYQEPGSALNPTMRVGEQIAEVLRVAGASKQEAHRDALEMIDRVALGDPAAIARRYPHQLSGGQQQRVVIAMALAVRPTLLVLDEPTTGLDATVEQEILSLVRELRRDLDAAIVFITHDFGLVEAMCDRVAVLYGGEVVEQGTVDEVLRRPRHPYTTGLLASVPRPGRTKADAPLPVMIGAPPSIIRDTAGCSFATRCPAATEVCESDHPTLELIACSATTAWVRCHHHAELANVGLAATEGRPTSIAVRDRNEPERRRDDESRPAALAELRDVTKRYDRTVALDGVSLRIGAGEVVGLVGESGSGKTTLGRVLTGLTVADAGTILLDGAPLEPDLRRRTAAQRRAIQMVFQSPDATLNPRHRVREVLARSLKMLGGSRTVEELADACRIEPGHLDRLTSQLSGGQKQRVAIARAVAGDAPLVVCDEPVSALDVSVQASILRLLVELQEQRSTSYLFVSHDLGVVGYLADWIVVMNTGQIVEQGPAADVFAHPEHPYTQRLLAASERRAPVAVEPPVVDMLGVVSG